jgi:hypothetical protein
MTTTYYVKASVSADGNYADCTYSRYPDGTGPVTGSQLKIAKGETSCLIAPADGTDLVLMACSYKTFGHEPAMSVNNFCPSDANDTVEIPMPADQTVTKGVVLLFSKPDAVECIYPSSDPEVINGGE